MAVTKHSSSWEPEDPGDRATVADLRTFLAWFVAIAPADTDAEAAMPVVRVDFRGRIKRMEIASTSGDTPMAKPAT